MTVYISIKLSKLPTLITRIILQLYTKFDPKVLHDVLTRN